MDRSGRGSGAPGGQSPGIDARPRDTVPPWCRQARRTPPRRGSLTGRSTRVHAPTSSASAMAGCRSGAPGRRSAGRGASAIRPSATQNAAAKASAMFGVSASRRGSGSRANPARPAGTPASRSATPRCSAIARPAVPIAPAVRRRALSAPVARGVAYARAGTLARMPNAGVVRGVRAPAKRGRRCSRPGSEATASGGPEGGRAGREVRSLRSWRPGPGPGEAWRPVDVLRSGDAAQAADSAAWPRTAAAIRLLPVACRGG
jgi:hypothetical protein